ncbi:hypothetical protein BS47DRAFT_1488853 [Hydnum rufescens UP504]|uniref:Uncharacterized protein n=1 Tax=Hydnum rufescens UP504 TaxID=1448309 RepID=A0A9P6AKJ0_9AGAM|nr:hypothetical protein BS47DRAFT_1488853 [Hydnum rufescens UP504]
MPLLAMKKNRPPSLAAHSRVTVQENRAGAHWNVHMPIEESRRVRGWPRWKSRKQLSNRPVTQTLFQRLTYLSAPPTGDLCKNAHLIASTSGHRGPTTDVTPPMSVALVSYEGWGNSQGKVLAVVTAQTDFHFLCEESCDRHLAWGGPVDTKVKRAENPLSTSSLARGIAAKLCTFKISRLYTGFTAKELPFTVQDYGHPPRPRTVNGPWAMEYVKKNTA